MANKVQYEISLNDKNFGQTIDDADKKVNRLESSLGSLSKAAAIGLTAIAAAAVTNLAGDMIQLAMDAEQAQIKWEVMLGSAQKATQTVSELKEMGAKTPFEFKDLQDAGLVLKSFNVETEKVLPTLHKLGDISGGDVQKLDSLSRAFGKASSAGKLTGEMVNMMIDASFNPLAVLAKEMSEKDGISMESAMSKLTENMSKGKISIGMLEHAITVATSEGGQFFGMMDKQSQTTAGRISTMQDNFGQLKMEIGMSLLPVVNVLVDAIGSLTAGMMDAVNWAKSHGTEMKAIGIFLGVLSAGILVYTAYLYAGTVATGIWEAAQWALNAAMTANPIGLVIAGVAALAAGIYYLWNKVDSVRGAIVGLWEAGKQVFMNLWEAGKTYLGGIADLLVGIFTLDVDKIKKGLLGVYKGVKDGYTGFGKGVGEAFNKGWDKGVAMKGGIDTASSVDDPLKHVVDSTKTLDNTTIPGAPANKVGSGSGANNITINIGNLVNELIVKTENFGTDKNKIAAEVSKLFLGVVNDANRLAGI